MTLWVDAQLSPAIATFIEKEFGVPCFAVRELGLRESKDEHIFEEARKANAVIMTKDEDFSILVGRYGNPPQILWITCGNTSNAHLCDILRRALPSAFEMLNHGEPLVEIF